MREDNQGAGVAGISIDQPDIRQLTYLRPQGNATQGQGSSPCLSGPLRLSETNHRKKETREGAPTYMVSIKSTKRVSHKTNAVVRDTARSVETVNIWAVLIMALFGEPARMVDPVRWVAQ